MSEESAPLPPISDEAIRSDMHAAMSALRTLPPAGTRGITSDLSIDETLLLHGAGWEPRDLVTGVSVQMIPYGAFMTPVGQSRTFEVPSATQAVMEAFRLAADRVRQECARVEASGAVGVEVEVEIESRHVRVTFTGTAVRPIGTPARASRPFCTDLSTRDFILLERAGWAPVDLAVGASFVGAPLRGLGQFIAQTTQNMELENLTQALQDAREKAMERMQAEAIAAGAGGVVDVSILDGPLGHSRHILGFICYGTSVSLMADSHRFIEPELVLPLDSYAGFEATSLRE